MLNHGKEFRPAIPALASALLIGLTAPAAQADVILNTFGPGNTAPGTAYGLSNPGQSLAVPFSISSEQTISEILTSISGQGSFTLGVVAGAGLPYGPMLFSASLSNSEPTVLASLSGLNWSLPSGDYWLVGIGAPNSSGFWRGGAVSGTFAYSFLHPVAWVQSVQDLPAVRINSAVPEPSVWVLALAGAALFALKGFKHH